MTTFDKIDIKLAQFATLSITILLSRKWFTWLMKLPVFALFVCVWVITYPYFWARTWTKRRHAITISEWEGWLIEKAVTKKLIDFVDFFN